MNLNTLNTIPSTKNERKKNKNIYASFHYSTLSSQPCFVCASTPMKYCNEWWLTHQDSQYNSVRLLAFFAYPSEYSHTIPRWTTKCYWLDYLPWSFKILSGVGSSVYTNVLCYSVPRKRRFRQLFFAMQLYKMLSGQDLYLFVINLTRPWLGHAIEN